MIKPTWPSIATKATLVKCLLKKPCKPFSPSRYLLKTLLAGSRRVLQSSEILNAFEETPQFFKSGKINMPCTLRMDRGVKCCAYLSSHHYYPSSSSLLSIIIVIFILTLMRESTDCCFMHYGKQFLHRTPSQSFWSPLASSASSSLSSSIMIIRKSHKMSLPRKIPKTGWLSDNVCLKMVKITLMAMMMMVMKI